MAILSLPAAAQNEIFLGRYFPYGKFLELPSARIAAPGGTLDVAFAPGELRLPRQTIIDWVAQRLRIVTAYFGRLPDPAARLLIVPSAGSGVRGGTTWGYRGAASRILMGRDTTVEQLRQDWILVHELIHHAMPTLDDPHDWMEEGLATYVESVARAQSGTLGVEAAWAELMKGLPQGLPQSGDRGLDQTPTWGRTYWGGALYFLVSDIEIRRRTSNKFGLQDALRALVAGGANNAQEWPITRVLAVADTGTGTSVLRETYDRMKHEPVNVDLNALWRELGISLLGGEIRFDDAAPLALIRIAIMRPLSSAP
ncbi:MAG: hypothetical protein ABL878_06035 [Burkholderiales bacterium]